MNGGPRADLAGLLLAGGPSLLIFAVAWAHLLREQRRERREQAKTRHPAKGTLSADEQLEWMQIAGALASEMAETEGAA